MLNTLLAMHPLLMPTYHVEASLETRSKATLLAQLSPLFQAPPPVPPQQPDIGVVERPMYPLAHMPRLLGVTLPPPLLVPHAPPAFKVHGGGDTAPGRRVRPQLPRATAAAAAASTDEPRRAPHTVVADLERLLSPETRLIVLLREPVSRFLAKRAAPRQRSPLDDDDHRIVVDTSADNIDMLPEQRELGGAALSDAQANASDEVARAMRCVYFNEQCSSVRDALPTGCYSAYLDAWVASPRMAERMLFVRYEDLLAEPLAAANRVLQFAGLPLFNPSHAHLRRFVAELVRPSLPDLERSQRATRPLPPVNNVTDDVDVFLDPMAPDQEPSKRDDDLLRLLRNFYDPCTRHLSKLLGQEELLW